MYTPCYRDTKTFIAKLGLAECEGCAKHYSSGKLNINLEYKHFLLTVEIKEKYVLGLLVNMHISFYCSCYKICHRLHYVFEKHQPYHHIL